MTHSHFQLNGASFSSSTDVWELARTGSQGPIVKFSEILCQLLDTAIIKN